MTRKKSRFMTFLISLMPGAGEMYLGFYKCGASIMVLFLGGMVVFGALIPQLLYLLTVLWFYSFFHTNNINGLPDEEFYALEDDYFMSMSPENVRGFCGRYKKYIGIALLLLGVSVAWNGAYEMVQALFTRLGLPDEDFTILYRGRDAISQLIAAVIIIVMGCSLFKAKKESLQALPYLSDTAASAGPAAPSADTAAKPSVSEETVAEEKKSRKTSDEVPRETPFGADS